MKENLLIDLSKQFAVDVVNLCTEISFSQSEKQRRGRAPALRSRREGKTGDAERPLFVFYWFYNKCWGQVLSLTPKNIKK